MYTPTIGLEVHAELNTNSKLFCGCSNKRGGAPNTYICPVCMGYPGSLPVINKKAIEEVIRVGVALNGDIAEHTRFDRKNYFYPDIPKGYQISQYKHPLVTGGELAGVAITRVHLEEDTGSNSHTRGDYSLIDFNRSGVPLMELVTEPVIKTSKEARHFAEQLQILLKYLNVSLARMELGEMRVEVNISLSKSKELGTKVEVKNINSFKAVEKAILYETKRQTELLDNGGEIMQETRGWDEKKDVSFSQRKKEEAEDYRYFNEPDIPNIDVRESFSVQSIEKSLPELPSGRLNRLISSGIVESAARILVNDIKLGNLFDECVKIGVSSQKLLVNYITSDIVGLLSTGLTLDNITPSSLSELINLLSENKLSSRGAKDALSFLAKEGGSISRIVEEKNLLQVSDDEALNKVIKKVLDENVSVVNDYKGGKEESLKYLIGQGMKESRGRADPKRLQELLMERIS